MYSFFISAVYSYGCYKTYKGDHILRSTVKANIKGSDVIQQCITAANKVINKNFQGIGIRNFGSNGYGCYADTQADLRYNKHGPAANCGSEGLGAQNTNATAVFLFTGEF